MTAGPQEIRIPVGDAILYGDMHEPDVTHGTVLFAHGSGSSRKSPRNRFVAEQLRTHGLGTLLFDLLTVDEERIDAVTRQHRFNIPFLAERLVAATNWLLGSDPNCGPLGYFGASTGAAAALVAAAAAPEHIRAVVSRGGRPDLAGGALPRVQAPTLLIVGGADTMVLELNRDALQRLRCEKRLDVIPSATHLFEEPGALENVAARAGEWFASHLARPDGNHGD